jgi:hypothetical protein
VSDEHGPQLPVKDAAQFLIGCYTREYRRSCLALWRELWGDEYADKIRGIVELHFLERKGKR